MESPSPGRGGRRRPSRRRALGAALLVTGAGLATPGPGAWELAAQAPAPPLAHQHWSYELLDALDVAGLADAWMVHLRPVDRATVRRELDRSRGVEGAPEAGWSAWVAAFDAEWPLPFDGRSGAELRAAGGSRSGGAFLEPGGGAYVAADGALALGGAVALWGRVDSGSGSRFDGLTGGGVALPFPGPLQLVVGRQRLRGGGPGLNNSLLGGSLPLDAVQLVSSRAAPLPGLDWLFGPIAWQFALAPWGGAGDLSQGWLGLGSAVLKPHDRVRLGVTRVARFGGAHTASVTPERFVRTFLAVQNDPTSFDDQLFELSLRVRWTPFGLPLSTYVVLAQDDSPLWKQPGLQLGTAASLVGGGGVALLRYEYSAIGRRARWCPGCPYQTGKAPDDADLLVWYRHDTHGLYQRQGVPAGSSLGGYGAEHRVSVSYFPSAARLRYRSWGFVQVRDEGNLLWDRWPGERLGLGGEVSWIPRPGLEATASGLVAGGPRIETETGLWLRVRLSFPSLAR